MIPRFILLIAIWCGFCNLLHGQSVAELNETAYKAYIISDKALNKAYAKVLKDVAYDAELKAGLVAAQKAFLSYRSKEAVFYTRKFKGGSMLPCFRDRALKKITDARIKQLLFYFNNE